MTHIYIHVHLVRSNLFSAPQNYDYVLFVMALIYDVWQEMLGSKIKAIDGEIVFASKAALSSVEQSKKVGLDCMCMSGMYVCMYVCMFSKCIAYVLIFLFME